MLQGVFTNKKQNKRITFEGYDFQNYFEFSFEDPKRLGYLGNQEINHKEDYATAMLKGTNIVYLGSKLEHNVNPFNHEDISMIASILFHLKKSCTLKNEAIESGKAFNSEKTYEVENAKIKSVIGALTWAEYEDENYILKLRTVGYNTPTAYFGANKFTVQYKTPFVEQKNDVPFFAPLGQVLSLDEVEKVTGKDFTYIKSKNLRIISRDDLDDFIQMLRNHSGPIALDTETSGLGINCLKKDYLVGLVFSTNSDTGYYVPLKHTKIENVCEEDEVEELLHEKMGDLWKSKKWITHNGSFDWKVMWNEGINFDIWFDTLIAFRLTIWNKGRISLVLKDLAKKYLGHDSLELGDLIVGGWKEGMGFDFKDLPYEQVKFYAPMDTVNTFALYEYVRDNNLLNYFNAGKVFRLECDFAKAVGYQEYYGHHVAIEKVPQLIQEYSQERDKLYAELKAIAGRDFNPRSTKDLQDIMFNTLKMPVLARTDSGNPSTAKEVLKTYKSQGYDFASILLEYRDVVAFLSNFLENAKDNTNGGFFFSRVQQFLETGRVSVSDPNYQSYNNPVKKQVTARDGYYFLDFDFSSVEIKIMTSMAKQENLIERFNDDFSFDYHRYQASQLWQKPEHEITKAERSVSKGLIFGIMYGMAINSLQSHLGMEDDPNGLQKTQRLYDTFFETQQNTKQFFQNAQQSAVNKGWTDTVIGRRRYMDINRTSVNKVKREGANHRIQGSAADYFKKAVVNLMEMIEKNDLMGKILIEAFIHDECVLAIHKSINPGKALNLVIPETRFIQKGWATLTNEMGFGGDWCTAKMAEIPTLLQDFMMDDYKKGNWDWWNGDVDLLVAKQEEYKLKYNLWLVERFLSDERMHKRGYTVAVFTAANKVLDLCKQGKALELWGTEVEPDSFEISDDNEENFLTVVKLFGLGELFENANIGKPEKVSKVSSVNESIKKVANSSQPTSPKEALEVDLWMKGYSMFNDVLWLLDIDLMSADPTMLVTVSTKLTSIVKENQGDRKVVMFNPKTQKAFKLPGISSEGISKLIQYIVPTYQIIKS